MPRSSGPNRASTPRPARTSAAAHRHAPARRSATDYRSAAYRPAAVRQAVTACRPVTARAIAAAFACAAMAAACSGTRAPGDGPLAGRGTTVPTPDPLHSPFLVAWGLPDDSTFTQGVHLRITGRDDDNTTGLPVAGDAAPAGGLPTAPPQPLPDPAASELLLRLAGPAPAPPATTPFRFPTASIPAPRPGATIRMALPADPAAAAVPTPVAGGPVRVLHTAPHGTVATTSQVMVVFSRPMVRLGRPDAVPAGVRLEPEVEGAWRWLDPSTLVFESAGPLRMATRYAVELPAGLASAEGGGALSEAVRWTFTTSPPSIRDVVALDVPNAAQPLIGVLFDQAVDTAGLAERIRLEVDGEEVALRPAEEEERRLSIVQARFRLENRAVAVFRPVRPLPAGDGAPERVARVHLAAGVRSLEGPERTAAPAVHEVRLRPGLRVMEHGCGRSLECGPWTPWTIRFNYPLRPAPDSGGWVSIEPELPGAVTEVWHDHLVVLGTPRRGETYTVRLAPDIAGWQGGELGYTEPLRFEVGTGPPVVRTHGPLATLPDDADAFPLIVSGADSVTVELRAVTPDDWRHFASPLIPMAHRPGRELTRTVLPVPASDGGAAEVMVDLGAALRRDQHLLLLARVTGQEPPDAVPLSDPGHTMAAVWIQRDILLLEAAEDPDRLSVRALSRDGRPAPGVRLELPYPASRDTATAFTDLHGLASLPRPGSGWLLLASSPEGTVLLPDLGADRFTQPHLRHHILTDRPLYAPGDTVRFAGWLRRPADSRMEPAAPAAGLPVVVVLNDPRGVELHRDTLQTLPNGRVHGSIPLPDGANSGRAHMRIELLERPRSRLYGSASIEIQEVRRPTFEVDLELDPGPHVAGGRIAGGVRARYFTGGSLPGGDVRWHVRSAPVAFSPPGLREFRFGAVRGLARRWTEPSARESATDGDGRDDVVLHIDSVRPDVTMSLEINATVTDVDRQRRTARAALLVHPAEVHVGLRAVSRIVRPGDDVVVDVHVVDAAGRAVPGRPVVITALRQRRSDLPGGMSAGDEEAGRCTVRSAGGAVRCTLRRLPPGDYIIVATAVDAAGRRALTELPVRVAGDPIPASAAVRDSVSVELDRSDYEPGDTALVLVRTTLHEAEALLTVRRAGVVESVPFRIRGGTATLRLPVPDAWVPNVRVHVAAVAPDGAAAAGEADAAVATTLRRLNVAVEPRSEEVRPGAATAVLVKVTDPAGRPVPGADVVLSGVDEALYALSRRPLTDPLADMYPRLNPAVTDHALHRFRVPAPGPAPGPGAIEGVVLAIGTARPVSGAWVEVAGTAAGAWTRANGAYRIAGLDPGPHLLRVRHPGYVGVSRTAVPGRARTHFLLATRQELMTGSFGMGFASAIALNEAVIAGSRLAFSPAPPAPEPSFLRTLFTPVAVFEVDARTGPDGTVEVPVTVPHNLTRYRLRAVAALGERRFGAGEAALTASRPLMVRPVPPRFLHADDSFELPAIIENRAGAPLTVDVAVRAANARLDGPSGRRVTVPADDRLELRFPVRTGAPGSATFQIAVAAVGPDARHADAAEVSLPVYSPAVTEAFAVYGELDDARPRAFPVRLPEGAIRGRTNIEVGFATTAVHGLADALLFLIQCVYELPEVNASRILALSALRDVPASWPGSEEEIDRALRRDVGWLVRQQVRDGGWSLWSSRFDSDPFVTVHVASALVAARDAGIEVPELTLRAAASWLERADEYGGAAARPGPGRGVFAADYPVQARRAVQAYALEVRRRMGDATADPVSASASALLAAAGAQALSAEALAWLLPSLASSPEHGADAAEVVRELNARAVRSAGTAAFVSPYDAGGREVLHTNRRTDAIVLGALVETGVARELTAALARGLFAHRVRGRWSNTLENAYAVASLARYVAVNEAVEPALQARAWAGPRLVADHGFTGRHDVRAEAVVPADSLGEPGTELDVTVAREGAGRLYYRLGMSWSLAGLPPAAARGFEVDRWYEPVDEPDDVRRDADGTWRIRAGARVRVHVLVGAAGPRYHVAVIDPLPAGFEAVNTALAGTAAPVPAAPRPVGDAAPPAAAGAPPFYPDHVNVKDNRYEAFALLLPPGRHRVSYLALATTPGDFTAPPPRAEEMYAPETHGRGRGERVVIEAR